MDGSRFDNLTRRAATTSRRGTLRFLAGGALGGLLTRLDRRAATAACAKVSEPCGQDADCCEGARCARNGTCRCKAGLTACDGRCRNLQTNPNHCGTCGNVCASGLCVAGVCCPPRRACAGVCCPPDARCVRSRSGGFACVQACPSGQTRCFDRCVDLTDPQYCGSCLGCPSGQRCCGGRCVDAQTDPTNCGWCGRGCGPGQICAGGTCLTWQGSCPAGADTCTSSTPVHCDGSSCRCFTSTEGATRCGNWGLGDCTSSAECARFGVGAFCAKDTGFRCIFNVGSCALPCRSTCPADRQCGGACCGQGETCLDGACCPADRVCGSQGCCPAGTLCVNGTLCCANGIC